MHSATTEVHVRKQNEHHACSLVMLNCTLGLLPAAMHYRYCKSLQTCIRPSEGRKSVALPERAGDCALVPFSNLP